VSNNNDDYGDDDDDDNDEDDDDERVRCSYYKRKLPTSSFHFRLSAARNLSSFQLLPTSLQIA
jgi:hypothetical protein